MAVTRRRLLAGAAGAGLAWMCPPLLQKAGAAPLDPAGIYPAGLEPARLYPEMDLSHFDVPLERGGWRLELGCAAITWGKNVQAAMAEIAAAGYRGIQLLATVLEAYPDPAKLKAALAGHGLRLVALSSGTAPLDPAKEKETLELHAAHARYLAAAGGGYLQVIGAGTFQRGQSWTADDYRRQGALLTAIGRRAAEYGVKTGFHNHMGTIAQTPAALEAILEAADPNYVKLELDVAHYLEGGGDPAAAVRQYGRRLLFLHLKDVVDAPGSRDGYQFVELGQGRVNFRELLAALEQEHFRGWGVVELDGERPGAGRTPAESARMSRAYLEQMGVRV